MAKDNVTRRISIYVNGKEVENSLKGVESAMSHVRNKMRLLNKDSETYEKDSKELTDTMTQLRERQSEYREELGLTSKTMKETSISAGGLRGNLTGIWDSLVSGDLQGAKEGISGLKDGMLGLGKATLAFLASPIGIAVAGLAGLATGAKALFDYNKGLTELNYKLESLGVATENISKVRYEIQATAETYDKDFNELAEKANSLAKSYGISMSEANEIIAKGLADGGAYNDEFLDSIGEYDEFFSKAGYSAQEFANIINTGYDLGIYSDKLPDALKEADLALKEQTDSTKEALENAFGASFSDDILNRVKSGEITTKQALEEIAKKSNEVSLSQQQQAQLTADVFKGAGEDAGGALKIFEAIGTATQKTLGETGKSYDELRLANERLNKAQAELFEIKGFGDIWTGIKTASLTALAAILEYVADVKEDIQPLIDLVGVVFVSAWDVFKNTVVSAFDVISGIVKAFASFFGGIIQLFKKLIAGDFSGAFTTLMNAVSNAFKHIGNVFINLYNNAIDLVTKLIDNVAPVLDTLGIDVDKLKEKIDGFKGTKFEITGGVKTENETSNAVTNTVTTNGISEDDLSKQRIENYIKELETKKARLEAFGKDTFSIEQEILQNQLSLYKKGTSEYENVNNQLAKLRVEHASKMKSIAEAEAKDEYNKNKALVDAKAKLAKAQLDQYLVDLKSNIDKEKQLTPEILAAEEDRLDTIRNKKNEFELQEYERKKADLLAKAELEKTSQEELDALLETMNIEYNMKVQENDLAFQQQTDELKKQYEEEQKILEAEQLAIENELAIAEAETKAEEDKIKEQQAFDAEMSRYNALLASKKISQEQYDAFVSAAKDRQLELDKQRDLAQAQSALGAMGQLAGAMTAMFGQSKEMAIAQAAISGAQAVISVWQAPAAMPQPYDAILKGVITAGVVANTISQISQIKKQKKPKTPKFYYGGATGDKPALGNDEYGPVTGYVHKNEYVIPEVMTKDPQFADTIGWLEQNRQRKLRGFVDGGAGSPGVVPTNTTQQVNTESTVLANAIDRLNANLERGIYAKAIFGYNEVQEIDDMNNEIKQSKQNGIVG